MYIVIRYNNMEKSLTSADYESLAELRYQIRRFLHFSEQASREVGLEPRQHQLMLALKRTARRDAAKDWGTGGAPANSAPQHG